MASVQDFFKLVGDVLSSRRAEALALSKGGWEGWIQCELWNAVNDAGTTVERERQYPGFNLYCDLVCALDGRDYWIELKAYGIFQTKDAARFLDAYANDVMKLNSAPRDAGKLALLVVPENIGQQLAQTIKQRWTGVVEASSSKIMLFYVKF